MNISIHYPIQPQQQIVLRCDLDWKTDILPSSQKASTTIFSLPEKVLFWKPCLRTQEDFLWAKSANQVSLGKEQQIWPYFREHCGGISPKLFIPDIQGHTIRVYTPPSYHENTLKKYPVLYMHDGGNVFFAEEAFLGREWQADETMDVLNRMNIIQEVIVVAVYPKHRMKEYTQQGYEQYTNHFVDCIKPFVDAQYRTLPDKKNTFVMGSSLGGVVSFFMLWSRSDVFGGAACLSSTFGYADNLFEIIHNSPIPKGIRVYLDSGWPKDNFERTRTMAAMLQRKGMRMGSNLMYLTFPKGKHNERYWADRLHIPYQFLFAKRWNTQAEEYTSHS